MSDRVVKVSLRAEIAQYKASMLQAAQATRTVGTEAEKLAAQRQAFQQLGRGMMLAGGVIAAGVGVAVKKFADFDQAMSNVAATGEDARNSMQALRDAAIDAGAKTVFSATESANAIEELAKAGVDAKDILSGGLAGALDLAAAGGLGVADAAGIAAVALKTFNLQGSDMGHVADLLAAGAGKAMGDVSDLSAALAQGGQVAAATGLSIEETTAALASFASQGLLGSDAGTSLKTMLQRLTPQSKEAAAQFDALGISAYDANGEFVGLANFSGQLQTAMKDLTPEARNAAMSVMFGSDAVRAANVLYSEGESGIRDWISAVDDQGYAAETAATRLDNLKGDWEALTGAVDSALITMGSAADGPLRGVVQGLTALVDAFNDLPDEAQGAVAIVGGAVAAFGLVGGAALLATTKVVEFRAALVAANISMKTVGIAAAGVTAGLSVALGAVAAFATAQAEASARADEYATAIRSGAGAVDELIASSLSERGNFLGFDTGSAVSNAKELGITVDELTAAVKGSDKEFDAFAERVGKSAAEQGMASAQAEQLVTKVKDLRVAHDDAEQQIRETDEAQQALTGSTESGASAAGDNAAALRELAGQAQATGDEVEGLADQIRGFGSVTLDTREAARDFEAAFDDLSASIEENGATLDRNTEKGRANEDALDAAVEKTLNYAAAVYEKTGSEEKAAAVIENGRAELIKQLATLNITGEAAERYANKLGLIPSNINTAVTAETGSAQSNVDSFINRNANRRITVTVDTTVVGKTYHINGSARSLYAGGGAITGPGTGTSDSIPAMLSNGEHVLTADDVNRMGGQAAVYRWRSQLRAGVPQFASGGAVTLNGARDAVKRAEAKERERRRAYERASRSEKEKRKAAWEDAKDDLKDARADLKDAQRGFRGDLQTWGRAGRRGENKAAGMNGNGLSLVDQLFDIADAAGGKSGQRLRAQALKSEKQYLKLEKSADKAAAAVEKSKTKLNDLKDAAANMAARVADAVRSFFQVGDLAKKSKQTTTTRTVDGVEVTTSQSVSTPTTAKGIAASMKADAARMKAFADKLAKLAKKGLNAALLAEIAGLGIEAGEPIADALLTATTDEITSINKSYASMDTYSKQAGDTVADANYDTLIEKAQKQYDADRKDAEKIRKKLETETTRIIKTITGALKSGSGVSSKSSKSSKSKSKKKKQKKATGGPVFGPGTGTSDSIPAWLSNGEHVWTAAEVAAAGGHGPVYAMRKAALSGVKFAHGGPVVASSSQALVQGGGRALTGPNVNVSFVNPVNRDTNRDAWEAAQIIAGSMSGARV